MQIITVTGDPLTSIKETIITEEAYSKEFLELWAAYPTEGNRKDGTTYPLKCNKIKCQQAYSEYLSKDNMTHEEILNALEVESTDKQKRSSTYFRKGLLSWIKDKSFERYKGKSIEPVDMGYGTELY
jgi:hypothetical protein